jgi:hypothetical protein
MHEDDTPDADPSPGNENTIGNLDEAYTVFCARVGGDRVWSKTRLLHYFRLHKLVSPYMGHELDAAVKSALAGEPT